jgi:hypothetical protein
MVKVGTAENSINQKFIDVFFINKKGAASMQRLSI